MQSPASTPPSRGPTAMRLLMLMIGLCCAACSAVQAAPEAEPTLLQQLQTAAAAGTCSDTTQCRTVAVGARACGGPESYLAWSTEGTDAARVKSLAERHKAERKRAIEASGERSDCRMMSDPGAECKANRCELRSGQRALF